MLTAVLPVLLFAAQANSTTFDDLAARASSARLANDIPHAVEFYQQALKLNPRWPEGWLYLGTLLYDADQYTGCRDSLTRFVDLEPKAGPAWGFLGLCEFETGAYPNALAHIQRSLSAGPAEQLQMDAVLRFHEALLLVRTGEFDRALRKYIWFVKNTPSSPALLAALGIAALRQPILPKDIPSGRQDLYQAAGKAALFTLAGDPAQAEPAFGQLLARFPTAPGVHYMHGFYVLVTTPAQAMAEFRRELEIDASNASARAMLAWVMLNRGESALALPYAAKAAADAPTLPMAHYVFGRSLVETGDLKKGIEHLELAVKLDPTNLENHLELVTAYSKAGRTADARNERRRSVELAKEVDTAIER